MSSKKKSTKTVKKPKKKEGKQLETDEKFQKSVVELTATNDYLAQRNSMLTQSLAEGEEWHKQLDRLKDDFECQKGDYRSISADMTRQYKTMESEMRVRIRLLETELIRYKIHISETEAELLKSKKDGKLLINQKQEEIELLQRKNNAMENSYEEILHEALDNLKLKLNASKDQWEKRARMIQAKNKKVLLEFGLNPLDL